MTLGKWLDLPVPQKNGIIIAQRCQEVLSQALSVTERFQSDTPESGVPEWVHSLSRCSLFQPSHLKQHLFWFLPSLVNISGTPRQERISFFALSFTGNRSCYVLFSAAFEEVSRQIPGYQKVLELCSKVYPRSFPSTLSLTVTLAPLCSWKSQTRFWHLLYIFLGHSPSSLLPPFTHVRKPALTAPYLVHWVRCSVIRPQNLHPSASAPSRTVTPWFLSVS